MLPNFLIIGAMKAGTTSLHAYLADHPQVHMAPTKELHFFVESLNWSRGVDWYERQFEGAGDAIAVGEASPSYSGATYYPGVPQRIAAVLPDVRLVYVVRHPVERMRSMYLHQLAIGEERRPAVEAFADDEPYLNTSRYRWQLDRYLEHFDRDRLLVVTAEALRDDRAATLHRVFSFLGVEEDYRPAGLDVERHRTEHKRVPTRAGAVVQRLPVPRTLTRAAPASLRRWVRSQTMRPITASPLAEIPADLYAECCRRLRDDVAGLRELLDEDFDGWGLA